MPSLMVAVFRRLVAGVFIAALGACASPPNRIALPNGEQGYTVECTALHRCYNKAAEACPAGYTVLDSRSGSYVVPVFVGQYRGVNQYSTTGGTDYTMAIKCNR